MLALFLRYFDQQKGSLMLPECHHRGIGDRFAWNTQPESIAGTDRSRYISIDAESYFRESDEIDGKSDGKNGTRGNNCST